MWVRESKDKDGNTNYRYLERYTDPLTNKYKTVSVIRNKNNVRSQKDAQLELNRIIEQRIKDLTPNTLKTLTFHKACDEWLQHYTKHSGSKETTIKEKESNIRTVKKAIISDILITKINHKYLQDVIDNWSNSGTMGRSHIQALMIAIRSVFKYIDKYYGNLDISLLDRVDIPKKAITRDELQAKRENYLEDSELKELLECMDYLIKNKKHAGRKRNYMMVKSIIEFQAKNGMRIGELLAIQPDNIDFDNKTLLIDGTIVWKKDNETGAFGVKDTTKTTASYRTIGLTTQSLAILKSIMLDNKKENQWNEQFIDRGFIFTNTAGSPMDLNKVNNIIAEAVEISSIKKRVTTHTLRHHHISTLAQLGINLKAIQDRVGHSDYKTTLAIYTHVTDKMAQDMMNKLEYFNG
ncbi:site-specific integrase [Mammaliicoccus sciuri]|uniref:tyrosine-type recombinase/integrase n=1 Tax=Mammaliicoccus sciuri TaxID=1296 RepID=UPI0019524040|nr:site-specific integrase [Mammaliicoccus sciuri]QYG31944.1 site-specific integrase [Mammaliicoccus sciuri]